jgi:sphingolipid 4-desaturase/C4-monooxygenase
LKKGSALYTSYLFRISIPLINMCKIDLNNSLIVDRKDFHRSYTDEPHVSRRKLILQKYPEIENLFGNDPRPVPFVLLIIASQLTLAYLSQYMSILTFILIAWIYGGASSHALSLMTHEVSHNLVFKSRQFNEWFGILCNIGMGIPSSTMFKRYHMEHHQFQGYEGKDVDIPTYWEGRFFTTAFFKCIFLFLQGLFYALRPSVVRPKTLNSMDIMNIVVVILSDLVVYRYCGLSGVIYLVTSVILGMGLHPVAGHFIAEHYVFVPGTETYSYYGSLNWICWNVGYHNEHHDFPRVPGWRLPQVKAIAKEFYEDLPQHKSWTYVLYRFIMDPTIGPFSRVIRESEKNE